MRDKEKAIPARLQAFGQFAEENRDMALDDLAIAQKVTPNIARLRLRGLGPPPRLRAIVKEKRNEMEKFEEFVELHPEMKPTELEKEKKIGIKTAEPRLRRIRLKQRQKAKKALAQHH